MANHELYPHCKKVCFLIAVVSIALAGCATVDSGFGGVSMSPYGRFSELPEGSDFVNPLATVQYYDLRQQGYTEHFLTLTADGAVVETSDSLVTYHIARHELVALARETGPDYKNILIRPVVQAAVRRFLAGYRWDQLDSAHIREASEKTTRFAAAKLRPYHIVLESVVLRDLEVRQPLYEKAVIQTSVMKQRALQEKSDTQIAAHRAEQRRIEANGIVKAHKLIGPTLTRRVLEDDEIKTWGSLVGAPNTQIKIIESNNSDVEVTP